MSLSTHLSRHLGMLALALALLACGDDASAGGAAGSGGDGGRGGEGGSGGGGSRAPTGGYQSPDCRDDKRDALSVWCSNKTQCDGTLSERMQEICPKAHCDGGRDCYFVRSNSCGGYTIQHVLGVDAYSDNYHYDGAGKLVGVSVQPFAFPCARVRDYYGMECDVMTGSLECEGGPPEPDAGL